LKLNSISRLYVVKGVTFFFQLKVTGVDDSIQDEDGGVFVKDENNHLTGQLFEEPAIKRVIGCAPRPTADELKKTVEEQWKDYASRGFTTVTDLGYIRNPALDSLLEEISLNDTCPVRLAMYRIVHGPEQQAVRVTRTNRACCPQPAQVSSQKVGVYSLCRKSKCSHGKWGTKQYE